MIIVVGACMIGILIVRFVVGVALARCCYHSWCVCYHSWCVMFLVLVFGIGFGSALAV